MRSRISWGVLCAVLGFCATARAAPTLKDALDSAWAKHPLALSAGARVDESTAKREAAASWLADAPRISAGQKSDRWNQNAGAREWEAEIGVALQMPALRAARGVLAEFESASRDAHVNAEKWRLAGEVRESYWQARLAASELTLADRKVIDAQALSRDVERRFNAGEVARTDWNQALAAFKLAESAAADARAKAYRAERGFIGITGLSQWPVSDEVERSGGTLEQHPQVREWMRDAESARARQQETHATRRDPPEISLGTVRERASHGESSAGSVVLRLTVPLDAGARYRARQAAAGAERIEAEARIPQLRARLEADIASAREEIAQSARQVEFAEARLALSLETHALLDKAYRLGELDLPARLRAEADRFDAEISLARVRLERARNISRFNQASGFFP
ncbi:MAG: TolC family protein [Betaproteobacteria bacterium]|nr:TolC family protein [Betaproteobacteria bacterium]